MNVSDLQTPVNNDNSTSRKNLVFIFKAPKENEEDKFVGALRLCGYEAVNIPVLQFKYVNSEILVKYMYQLLQGTFSAIILTSTKAVDAISIALQKCDNIDLSDVVCYVVGKTTGDAARKQGFKPRGEQTGNAVELSKFIISDLKNGVEDKRPVLYPCSSIRGETIQDMLSTHDISIQELSVYDTCKNDALEESLQQAIKQKGLPEFAVFFSPSGVKFACPLITYDLIETKMLKVIAIGPTTETELVNQGIPIYGVAHKPDPESLIEILRKENSS